MKPNPLAVVRSIRDALSRVNGEVSITLTRAEFEALANAIEVKPARQTPKSNPAQESLALEPAPTPVAAPPVDPTNPPTIEALPGGLSPERLRALLTRPKTAATLAREVKLSPATVKRALAALPDVQIAGTRTRAHKPGRRPNVYAVH